MHTTIMIIILVLSVIYMVVRYMMLEHEADNLHNDVNRRRTRERDIIANATAIILSHADESGKRKWQNYKDNLYGAKEGK